MLTSSENPETDEDSSCTVKAGASCEKKGSDRGWSILGAKQMGGDWEGRNGQNFWPRENQGADEDDEGQVILPLSLAIAFGIGLDEIVQLSTRIVVAEPFEELLPREHHGGLFDNRLVVDGP